MYTHKKLVHFYRSHLSISFVFLCLLPWYRQNSRPNSINSRQRVVYSYHGNREGLLAYLHLHILPDKWHIHRIHLLNRKCRLEHYLNISMFWIFYTKKWNFKLLKFWAIFVADGRIKFRHATRILPLTYIPTPSYPPSQNHIKTFKYFQYVH